MACKIGGLGAALEIYRSFREAVVKQWGKGAAERLGVTDQFQSLEDRVRDVSISIGAIGKHAAHPPRRYIDYTPCRGRLLGLQRQLREEEAHLAELRKKAESLEMPQLSGRAVEIIRELDIQQGRCLAETQNVENVIRGYRFKKILYDLRRIFFG